ncbi:MAG: hypothetical protein ACKOAD_05675 [Gammaproteobacteria bacterium]
MADSPFHILMAFYQGLSKKPFPEFSSQSMFGRIDFVPLGTKYWVRHAWINAKVRFKRESSP